MIEVTKNDEKIIFENKPTRISDVDQSVLFRLTDTRAGVSKTCGRLV